MRPILILIAYFSICSFIGKGIELSYYSLRKEWKKFRDSGFLYGPFSPIYGFGALAIYFYSVCSADFPIVINLIVYFIIPTGLEYISSHLLEKVFDLRLWNYSIYKFNVNGRICLGISFVWFLFALLFVFLIQPFLFGILDKIPLNFIFIWAVVFLVYFSIDFSFSVRKYFHQKKMRKIFKAQDYELFNLLKRGNNMAKKKAKATKKKSAKKTTKKKKK